MFLSYTGFSMPEYQIPTRMSNCTTEASEKNPDLIRKLSMWTHQWGKACCSITAACHQRAAFLSTIIHGLYINNRASIVFHMTGAGGECFWPIDGVRNIIFTDLVKEKSSFPSTALPLLLIYESLSFPEFLDEQTAEVAANSCYHYELQEPTENLMVNVPSQSQTQRLWHWNVCHQPSQVRNRRMLWLLVES